ncbi:delta-60 repeat domain-containing protein [Longispora albida]|uniref:delta-60 repeat domain-containing protein n=1 Tax=Longispora albida TaxID=203523 RepID=UPI000476E6EF|nr:delta-60 repeat domain-containing protein [Longispora albida]
MRRRLLTLGIILLAGLVSISPASADRAHGGLVSEDPADWTPHVLDGTVYAFAVHGDTVVAAGDFSTVEDSRGQRYGRSNVFAFQLGTGKVLPGFAPSVAGPVRAVAMTGPGEVVIGGEFTEVNGARRRGLAKLRLDGTTDQGFKATVDGYGMVRSLAARGASVYAGGEFTSISGVDRPALARLDSRTGVVDPGFDLELERREGGRLWVQSLALSQDGSVLAFDGTFSRVQGARRPQVAVAYTDGGGTVADWSTGAYAESECDPRYETYLRGIDLSPDGSYLVVVSSGHQSGPGVMCNSAARFDVADGEDALPAWVNHTGGNTLLSVAITGAAVYVGGHQQWLDNPYGDKSAGPGAVSRPGIGAIDPASGLALDWNPGKGRGVGTEALVAYPGGLLVGSDTERLGGEYHARLGAFPLR